MGLGQLIKSAIIKVKDSPLHPVAKGAIIVLLFSGLGAATYFGVA